jgi:hypothetical protein
VEADGLPVQLPAGICYRSGPIRACRVGEGSRRFRNDHIIAARTPEGDGHDRLVNDVRVGRIEAASRLALTIGLTEEAFQQKGGGLLWWLVIAFVGGMILAAAATTAP